MIPILALRSPARLALEVDTIEAAAQLLELEPVERADIGLGRSNQRVGIRAARGVLVFSNPIALFPGLVRANHHFRDGVGAGPPRPTTLHYPASVE
jgi:hypothetical protein